jgi:AbrB family looped-hinge helix DNA binding protein
MNEMRTSEMNTVMTTKVGRRGQITLPRLIRHRLGLREGDLIALLTQDDQVVLRPLTQTLLDLRGSVPVSHPQDFSVIRKQVIASRGKNHIQDED